jgi:hypothetical protein
MTDPPDVRPLYRRNEDLEKAHLDAPRDASAAIFQSEWGSYRKAIDENYFSKPGLPASPVGLGGADERCRECR